MRNLLLLSLFTLGCGGPLDELLDAPAPVEPAPEPDQPEPEDPGPDLDAPVDEGPDDPPESRCALVDGALQCEFETLRLPTGLTALSEREVHFQVPTQAPPEDGYPVVIVFQGSFFTAELAFGAPPDAGFGAEHQTQLVRNLLDAGYAVVAPEAQLDGNTFWESNIPPFNLAWETSADHRLMLALFDAIAAGDFGPLDDEALFATGISSGGFMTSRMAVSYPGRFRALAIHSGSYAVCGAVCFIPPLPSDHPPTLLIHGADDPLVPLGSAADYHAALGPITDTELIVVDGAGHAWLPPAPIEIPAWFDARR